MIILPTREFARKLVENIVVLLKAGGDDDDDEDAIPEEQTESATTTKPTPFQIMHSKRFYHEYGFDKSTDPISKLDDRASDFKETFGGNTDDNFRIGLKVSKKSVKLFTSFETSDIIIASPLGMRTVMTKDKNCDFLSSIEILVIDRAEMLLMQNWDHLSTLVANINQSPKRLTDVDVNRIRSWDWMGCRNTTGRLWCSPQTRTCCMIP